MKLAHRVLVVDSDAPKRERLVQILKAFGYETLGVPGVPDALETLGALSVDVIVLELELKGHSGLALLAGLDKAGLELPAIVIRSRGVKAEVVAALRHGAVDWLDRPIGPGDLKQAVERALERLKRRRKRREARNSKAATSDGRSGEHDGPTEAERAETHEAVQELVEQISAGKLRLPSMDPVAQELQELFHSPDPGVNEVLEVVERDAATAAAILRAANSSSFQGDLKIGTLRGACVRLGNRRVLTLAQEVMARDLFDAGRFGTTAEKMWANVRVTSQGARLLAEQRGGIDPDEAHLAGLFHNLGELVLLRAFVELSQERPTKQGLALFAAECEDHHQRVGGELLKIWRVPAELVDLATCHHEPPEGDPTADARAVRQVVLAAWQMALHRGFTYLPGQTRIEPWNAVDAVGLSRDEADKIFARSKEWLT
jgi:HD-like signal output (HDOD) protein/FixJ family two-component response regulator